VTIWKLSMAIYPPGSWLTASSANAVNFESTPEVIVESWSLRSGLSNWAWRTISELKDAKDASKFIFMRLVQ
jgi:hypothetical protein